MKEPLSGGRTDPIGGEPVPATLMAFAATAMGIAAKAITPPPTFDAR